MSKTQFKIENPMANVLNEVNEVVESVNKIYLIIIIIFLAAQLATTLYQLHKRSLKKRYEKTFQTVGDDFPIPCEIILLDFLKTFSYKINFNGNQDSLTLNPENLFPFDIPISNS